MVEHINEEMLSLLATTRQVNRALQGRRDMKRPDFDKLAAVLSEFSDSNVYIVSSEGRILGHCWVPTYDSAALRPYIERGMMPESIINRVSSLRETVLDSNFANQFDDAKTVEKVALMVPINGSGENLGVLFLSREGANFPPKDLVLAEYLATLAGIEILHDRKRIIEEQSREQLVVQMAMGALSFSEVESVRHIIEDLGSYEGVVVASRIADRVGVTRSVIVNALRKLEGAGIIESRSLGMKGTHIKLLSPLFVKELGVEFKNS